MPFLALCWSLMSWRSDFSENTRDWSAEMSLRLTSWICNTFTTGPLLLSVFSISLIYGGFEYLLGDLDCFDLYGDDFLAPYVYFKLLSESNIWLCSICGTDSSNLRDWNPSECSNRLKWLLRFRNEVFSTGFGVVPYSLYISRACFLCWRSRSSSLSKYSSMTSESVMVTLLNMPPYFLQMNDCVLSSKYLSSSRLCKTLSGLPPPFSSFLRPSSLLSMIFLRFRSSLLL